MQPRRFIRHPVNIPIEARREGGAVAGIRPMAYSVGHGGLAFRCTEKAAPGDIVRVRIPYLEPAFETEARVVWCRTFGDSTELGVAFLSEDDGFRARMVEQVCHIETYREYIRQREGRDLTAEEAASEWIERHAAEFPRGF